MDELIGEIFNSIGEVKKGRIISYEDALAEIGTKIRLFNQPLER